MSCAIYNFVYTNHQVEITGIEPDQRSIFFVPQYHSKLSINNIVLTYSSSLCFGPSLGLLYYEFDFKSSQKLGHNWIPNTINANIVPLVIE